MQLSEHVPALSKMGVSLVAVTYDSIEELAKFHDQRGLTYPLAKDPDSDLIKTLDILNTGPKPGDSAYGIPYPGMFLVDKHGIIRAKFAEASYRDRPDYAYVVEAAKALNQ